MNDYEVNKKIVPDIGDFFMLIFLSNKDMSSPEMVKIKNVLVEEFLIRQIYWMFHGPDCQSIMREKVIALNNVTRLNDDVYLEKFHNDPDFKMRYLDIFNKELHNKNIFNKEFLILIISGEDISLLLRKISMKKSRYLELSSC